MKIKINGQIQNEVNNALKDFINNSNEIFEKQLELYKTFYEKHKILTQTRPTTEPGIEEIRKHTKTNIKKQITDLANKCNFNEKSLRLDDLCYDIAYKLEEIAYKVNKDTENPLIAIFTAINSFSAGAVGGLGLGLFASALIDVLSSIGVIAFGLSLPVFLGVMLSAAIIVGACFATVKIRDEYFDEKIDQVEALKDLTEELKKIGHFFIEKGGSPNKSEKQIAQNVKSDESLSSPSVKKRPTRNLQNNGQARQ